MHTVNTPYLHCTNSKSNTICSSSFKVTEWVITCLDGSLIWCSHDTTQDHVIHKLTKGWPSLPISSLVLLNSRLCISVCNLCIPTPNDVIQNDIIIFNISGDLFFEPFPSTQYTHWMEQVWETLWMSYTDILPIDILFIAHFTKLYTSFSELCTGVPVNTHLWAG